MDGDDGSSCELEEAERRLRDNSESSDNSTLQNESCCSRLLQAHEALLSACVRNADVAGEAKQIAATADEAVRELQEERLPPLELLVADIRGSLEEVLRVLESDALALRDLSMRLERLERHAASAADDRPARFLRSTLAASGHATLAALAAAVGRLPQLVEAKAGAGLRVPRALSLGLLVESLGRALAAVFRLPAPLLRALRLVRWLVFGILFFELVRLALFGARTVRRLVRRLRSAAARRLPDWLACRLPLGVAPPEGPPPERASPPFGDDGPARGRPAKAAARHSCPQ